MTRVECARIIATVALVDCEIVGIRHSLSGPDTSDVARDLARGTNILIAPATPKPATAFGAVAARRPPPFAAMLT